jgi:uncharacterized protein (DUF2236 family)
VARFGAVTDTATPATTGRARRATAEGAPLGPDSILWRLAGDGRGLLTGTGAGILQLLYPGLGAGVTDHSAFFTEPWARIVRSIPQIWGTIFAEEGEGDERGRSIRDLHPTIKGVDHQGRRYHALDPDVFWWAHATFTWEFFRAAELFWPLPLSRREKEQLYRETVTWYRRYGVSDRPVPVDLAAFEARFADICAHELELTPAADWVLHPPADAPRPPEAPLPLALRPAAPALRWLRGENLRLVTLGSLPDVVRRRFAIPWTHQDRAAFAATATAFRTVGATAPQVFDVFFPPGTPRG